MKPKIKAGVLMVLCVLLMLGGTGVWAGEEFDAEVIGIDDGGAIRVLLGSGEVKSFSSAEVSVIL